MRDVGFREDNATNRAEWRKKLISEPEMTGQAKEEEVDLQGLTEMLDLTECTEFDWSFSFLQKNHAFVVNPRYAEGAWIILTVAGWRVGLDYLCMNTLPEEGATWGTGTVQWRQPVIKTSTDEDASGSLEIGDSLKTFHMLNLAALWMNESKYHRNAVSESNWPGERNNGLIAQIIVYFVIWSLQDWVVLWWFTIVLSRPRSGVASGHGSMPPLPNFWWMFFSPINYVVTFF